MSFVLSATSASASGTFIASGLSQMTSMPGFHERGRDRGMEMVRGDDDDGLDAVLALRLGLGHRAVVGVAAVGGDADLGRGGLGVLGVGGQRARDQRDLVVEAHREAMDGADEGVASAAHHPDAKTVARAAVGSGIDHRQRSSMMRR